LADLGGEFTGFDLVDVTPDPGLAGLDRAHHGMLGVVEMLGRVFILRRVATGGISADEAHAQVNPGVAGFDAIFADMFIGFSYFDLIEMGTFLWGHRFLLKLF
jgi:hypothetical protein